jgi:RNA polymerase sigma factor (sigma-70 family)
MAPDSDADRELVARAQGGDDQAFTDLMVRYQQPVLHFVFRLLAGAADAEDVAQETFVRAYFNLRRYRARPEARFSTWLFQIARHAALDQLRKRGRRAETPWPEGHAEPAAPEPSADRALQHRELGEALARACAALPEEQRTALVLAEYHGASVAEIAARPAHLGARRGGAPLPGPPGRCGAGWPRGGRRT